MKDNSLVIINTLLIHLRSLTVSMFHSGLSACSFELGIFLVIFYYLRKCNCIIKIVNYIFHRLFQITVIHLIFNDVNMYFWSFICNYTLKFNIGWLLIYVILFD